MQIKTVFQNAVQRLKQAAIADPELEVSLLLSHVLKMERTAVLLAGDDALHDDQLEIVEKIISRRLAREPLAYILGEKEFWSLPFNVSKDVLIPRPETEFLLEKILAVLKNSAGSSGHPVTIMDLGTGSGIIAIVLARELKAANVTAIDYSHKALKVAYHNAKRHNVAARINFINCSWFDGIKTKTQFDVVVSNPPYIARETLAKPCGKSTGSLQPEVGNFEPRLALDGGESGVQEIRRIAAGLGGVIKSGGWFFMEIGADQEKAVSDIFAGTAAYENVEIYNDYSGLPRVFQARKR